MTEAESESLVEDLENALEHAENRETEYWIRTALQRLVSEREEPEGPPPAEN